MQAQTRTKKFILKKQLKFLKTSILKFSKYNFCLNSDFQNTRKSLVRGSTEKTLREITIGQQLYETANKFPYNDALYIHHQKTRLSYTELNERVTQTAKAFISIGFNQSSKVAIYAPNCLEWVLTQYACARIGIPLANVNPAYQINDLKYSLSVLGITMLIMPRRLKSTNYLEIINQICPELQDTNQNAMSLQLKSLPDLKQIILLDDLACGENSNTEKTELKKIVKENNLIFWDDLYNSLSGGAVFTIENIYKQMIDSASLHDATNIQFTSGTTGLPKGAILSHYNILNNGFLIGSNLNYSEKDRVLIPVPLYHCFGSVMGNLACLNWGSTVVYPSATFDAVKILEILELEKCTSLYGVPTMFVEILNQQLKLKKNVSSLRTGIMAGSVCPKYLMERCIAELNLRDLTICYGMTELSPVTHQTSIHDCIEKKTTTVGKILPHTVTKIVDGEGNIVDKNTKGEICSKSFGLFKGYFANEQATKDSIDDEGFMKTGDIGFIDDEGYLHIEGRNKDVIIRGGENISPNEIEDYLGSHPHIDYVQVIAVKDEKFGDEICAWIKVKVEHKGELDKCKLIEFCKKKIAHYKIPRYFKFVDFFPTTTTGKPQKYKMREITNKILEEKSEEL
jgi:fatty-acyl-CoA synthase